jgi:hypothetical protein
MSELTDKILSIPVPSEQDEVNIRKLVSHAKEGKSMICVVVHERFMWTMTELVKQVSKELGLEVGVSSYRGEKKFTFTVSGGCIKMRLQEEA